MMRAFWISALGLWIGGRRLAAQSFGMANAPLGSHLRTRSINKIHDVLRHPPLGLRRSGHKVRTSTGGRPSLLLHPSNTQHPVPRNGFQYV